MRLHYSWRETGGKALRLAASMRRPLFAVLVSTAAGFGAGRPVQAALQPAAHQPTGRVCTLHSFAGPGFTAEPYWFINPGAIAVVGPDSIMYSSSQGGGKNLVGTIFSMTPKGDIKRLFDFNRTLGSGPQSGLVLAPDGNLCGTTYAGGNLGVGTLFRIAQTGTKPEILWHFRNGSTINLIPDCKAPCPYTPRQRADISGSYPTSPPVVQDGQPRPRVRMFGAGSGGSVCRPDLLPRGPGLRRSSGGSPLRGSGAKAGAQGDLGRIDRPATEVLAPPP